MSNELFHNIRNSKYNQLIFKSSTTMYEVPLHYIWEYKSSIDVDLIKRKVTLKEYINRKRFQ